MRPSSFPGFEESSSSQPTVSQDAMRAGDEETKKMSVRSQRESSTSGVTDTCEYWVELTLITDTCDYHFRVYCNFNQERLF